jgi:hypothetical protein
VKRPRSKYLARTRLVLLLAVSIATGSSSFVALIYRPAGSWRLWALDQGCIGVNVFTATPLGGWPGAPGTWSWSVTIFGAWQDNGRTLLVLQPAPFDPRASPRHLGWTSWGGGSIFVPLWQFLLSAWAAEAWLWSRRRRRHKRRDRGECEGCGYSLKGIAGPCPECGSNAAGAA